jgi:hypothetical protein
MFLNKVTYLHLLHRVFYAYLPCEKVVAGIADLACELVCYDVCCQHAPTVLVVASDWSESRGFLSFGAYSIFNLAQKSKTRPAQPL